MGIIGMCRVRVYALGKLPVSVPSFESPCKYISVPNLPEKAGSPNVFSWSGEHKFAGFVKADVLSTVGSSAE